MPVTRLNHAVLYVRDVERTREFYENVLGFKTLTWAPGQAAFFQAPGSTNDHDLGTFQTTGLEAIATQAQRPVLIAAGAALTARDNLVDTVTPYLRRDTAEREISKLRRQVNTDLRKLERRGLTARNRLERQVKRARTQLERQLRQRRNRVNRLVKRNARTARRDVQRNADKVGTAAADAVREVQSQVSSLA